jgi:hypothetical protein
MRHHSDAFSQTPLQEWLIYFKRSYRTFSVWIIGDDKEYRADGRYSYSFNVEVSLQIDVPDNLIALDLKADKRARWNRRLFGTAPLVGTIVMAGAESGSCCVENSHQEETPVIRVETKNPHCRLEAYRANPGLVSCPLLVFGMENCEVVLEDYEMLDKVRRRALPETPPKRNFVGSCRTIQYSPDPIGRAINEITVVVAVAHLIVKERYMRSD